MNKFGINEILEEIRKVSFTEREKGAIFEKLMKRWFKTDPCYLNLEKVWLWEEFPARKQFGGRDLGIDLVARTDDGIYWAIQCKCYDEDTTIDKKMLDSFLSTSSKVFEDENGTKQKFSNRILVSTTNHWGANAEETIRNQNPPVNRINLSDLQTSRIDWEKLFKGDYGKKARLKIRDPFPHQSDAINIAEEHFKNNDRGKLIMACGTGKTFTSLRIVEKIVGEKGLVLFMVPSIGLLGQVLKHWSYDTKKSIQPICICSDSGVVRYNGSVDEIQNSIVDLARPASTDPTKILNQLKRYKNHNKLVVVFSTYQSIDVISKAQKAILKETKGEYGVFDFIVCDEAHRTTGVKLSDKDESNFTKIHNNDIVQGKKRLYMTATPRIYGESAKIKASKNDCILCSMDDENIYGKEIYRYNFSSAVRDNILTDYKVLVLTVPEIMIPDNIMKEVKNKEVKELNYDDTGKLFGVISGLSKKILGDKGLTWEADPKFMQRALAFTYKIGTPNTPGTSKNIEKILPLISKKLNETLTSEEKEKIVSIKIKHVDGSMGALIRDEALSWLNEKIENPQECRVITNVRCLSEGIDVPALDAVLFLSAKNSQVDIVQSVGRVMRSFHKGQADEKKYGYIIIPIVVPENTSPEEALDDNKSFAGVWNILNALRSHDDHFNAFVNTIDLNNDKGDKVTIGYPGFGLGYESCDGDANDAEDGLRLLKQEAAKKMLLNYNKFDKFYAKVVEKCGERLYWENWASITGDIANRYKERINRVIKEENNKYTQEFNEFVKTLQQNLNPGVTPEQCIEMLAQHMITYPIFEALFKEYKFIEHNSISKSMQFMLDYLDSESVYEKNEKLNKYNNSVHSYIIDTIDNLRGKQRIMNKLYEKFFAKAFKGVVDKYGIVYTPEKCVDFIIRSVDYILKQDFGTALTCEDVHIHDPFTGTGTFITHLLQLGVIKPEDLKRKYMQEIHCNEIVLLAYYIANVNIESVFHELYKEDKYIPFGGICLTDTFQLGELDNESSFNDKFFKENSDAVERQRKAKIRVIIGNPPYYIGQKSANNNAQNQHYPRLEKKIADTYVAASSASLSKGLYDSYIKAFRWSTDRIDEKDGGIVAFITNGKWIDGNSHDGFRATLAKDFDKIYVFNLRGNCTTQGERRRKEGGGIFGDGSKTQISISILVKYPKDRHKKESCEIFYHDIGDYLSTKEKLDKIKDFGSVENIKWDTITPNEKYDWINQRDGVFDNLLPLEPEKKFKADTHSVFVTNVVGVATGRDVWVSGFSQKNIENNMMSMIEFYNDNIAVEPSLDERKISWTVNLNKDLAKRIKHTYDGSSFVTTSYRPFTKMMLYYHRPFIERPGIWDKIYPTKQSENLVICLSCVGTSKGLSCFISSNIPDYHFLGDTHCFPLYWYKENEQQQLFLFSDENDKYIRRDGITDWILKEIRNRFQGARSLTKEDIFYYVYGFLHSPDYRTRFADDLRKSLPRIHIIEDVKDFMAFSNAGRELAELHLNYEDVEPYPDVEVKGLENAPTDEKAYDYFRIVDKMRFKSKDDKTAITLNANIEVSNIPEKAYEYVVNGKSAIEWIVERYCISQDKKSGIVNDCNAWAREHEKPRYVLDLLLSVINVSVKTVDIVNSLPRLKFEQSRQEDRAEGV